MGIWKWLKRIAGRQPAPSVTVGGGSDSTPVAKRTEPRRPAVTSAAPQRATPVPGHSTSEEAVLATTHAPTKDTTSAQAVKLGRGEGAAPEPRQLGEGYATGPTTKERHPRDTQPTIVRQAIERGRSEQLATATTDAPSKGVPPVVTSPVEVAPPLPTSLLQFRDDASGPPTDVVIGFDFGTSSAKVAIQSPYKLGGRTVFVDFGRLGHPSNRYLLPVSVFADDSGALGLEKPTRCCEERSHLKLPLLSTSPDVATNAKEGRAWAAAFVALALRAARQFFLTNERQNYGSNTALRWALNLGIPSAGYDDSTIRSRFHAVAEAGWALSKCPTVTLPLAMQAIDAVGSRGYSDSPIGLVPEVAAEVVGYAKSRQRREGLHLILDIGASTLDLCAFVLHDDAGDDVYELLTADVRLLGLLELHCRRIEAANNQPPFDAVPRDLIAPLPEPDGAVSDQVRRELQECDRAYVEEAARGVLLRTMASLRQRRDPHSAAWREGLPLFVTGGASRSPAAEKIVRRADELATDYWVQYAGLRKAELLVPSAVATVAGRPAPAFERMAVAFGLSFPDINIGRIEPPSRIPDVEPPNQARSNWRQAFIDKDCL